MRRATMLGVGLSALAGISSAFAATPTVPGDLAYRAYAKAAIQDHGRVKPLDTAAREAIKHIFGRESIKSIDPATGKPTLSWPPAAAMLDWSARPEYWDDQPIILVEYLPLKRLLLADAAKARLSAVAAKPTTPEPARARLKELAEGVEVAAEPVLGLARDAAIPMGDRQALALLAGELGEETKHLSPREIESAMVSVEGKRVPFGDWLDDLGKRDAMSHRRMSKTPALAGLDKKALESGVRLRHYQAIRGDASATATQVVDALVPRPSNAAFMKFSGALLSKIRAKDIASEDALSILEKEALKTLSIFTNDLRTKERHDPGTNEEFDARYAEWLRQTSNWLSLKTLMAADPAELEAFGYPHDGLGRLRSAYADLREAEEKAPGNLPVAKAEGFVAALRDLGTSVSSYPTPGEVAREVQFNAFAPFYKAPFAYGAGLVLILLSLGIGADRRSVMGKVGQTLYLAGMAAFGSGILLEIAGFTYRVLITGWAPVTNMYETVIWVAFMTSLIGMVMELVTRKGYPAAAAAGVALLCTTLAATSPSLLDPDIHNLNPVLRSNFWLSIHVLTIVSSYAAFALAMGLGQLAVGVYLTATYRRAVGYLELAKPLLPGLPIAVIGAFGLYAAQGGIESPSAMSTGFYYLAAATFGLGGVLTIMGGVGMLGEWISRAPLRGLSGGLPVLTLGMLGVVFSDKLGLRGADAQIASSASTIVAVLGALTTGMGLAALLGQGTTRPLAELDGAADDALAGPPAIDSPRRDFSEAHGGAGTATLVAKPTIAEIRARAAASRPKLDPRALAMQRTASRVKPLANFVYRAMQVGVLLVAAGTILGGVWADYSWGRFWGWDAKEVWALITLLVYLVPLHGRFAGWVNTFGLVMASVLCFLSVLMAWYGVNFVLGVGLHSYGFVEGGAQGSVVAATVAVMAVAAAAAWRRKLASSSVA